MTPDQLVTQFCAEWIEPDPAKIAEYFAEDAVYHNIPMEPVIGRDAIREFVAGFIAPSAASTSVCTGRSPTAGRAPTPRNRAAW